ncbi:hypothetical protein C8Q80DRAFT_1166661 [Daedaleopsis nitida]|nr:hypothetical protein C8Q80DRAFT_1166661 [Daedaleopsis nitida]
MKDVRGWSWGDPVSLVLREQYRAVAQGEWPRTQSSELSQWEGGLPPFEARLGRRNTAEQWHGRRGALVPGARSEVTRSRTRWERSKNRVGIASLVVSWCASPVVLWFAFLSIGWCSVYYLGVSGFFFFVLVLMDGYSMNIVYFILSRGRRYVIGSILS